jgi:hypothetical protein
MAEFKKPFDYGHIQTQTGFTPYPPYTDPQTDERFKVESHKPYTDEIVTRATVWDYFLTGLALPTPSTILGHLNTNIKIWDELLEDGRVKAAFNNRRAGAMSLHWTIDQMDAPDDFYNLVITIFKQLHVYEAMSGMMLAPFYGYIPSEVIWNVVDKKIVPLNIVPKSPRWFVYNELNELHYVTKHNMTLGEPLPPRKVIVTRYNPTYQDPYAGQEALANSIYWPVKFRHMIMKYMMRYCNKYGMPWLDFEYEAGLSKDKQDSAIDVLKKTFEDGIFSHPNNTKINPLMASNSHSVENFNSALDMMNREIDMAVLGNNMSAEIKGGSFAAATALAGVRDDIIQSDIRMLEASWNQLIEWIAWYNFPLGTSLPAFKLYKNYPGTKDQAEILVMLQKGGVRLKGKAYICRTFGLNKEEFEMGEPVQELNPGSKGNVVAPITDTKISDDPTAPGVDNKAIAKKGIETKDQAVNTSTKDAVDKSKFIGGTK